MSFRSRRKQPRETAARREQQEAAKTARGGGGEEAEEKEKKKKLWARAIRRPPSAGKVSQSVIIFQPPHTEPHTTRDVLNWKKGREKIIRAWLESRDIHPLALSWAEILCTQGAACNYIFW